MDEILKELEIAESRFNFASTREEIDSAIFNLNAVQMKLKGFFITVKGSQDNYNATVW